MYKRASSKMFAGVSSIFRIGPARKKGEFLQIKEAKSLQMAKNKNVFYRISGCHVYCRCFHNNIIEKNKSFQNNKNVLLLYYLPKGE